MKKNITSKWAIIITCLFFSFLLLPINASAARNKADVQKLLPAYNSWFSTTTAYYPGGGKTDIHLICPEKDITFNEILYYIEDITQKLKGQLQKDKTTLCVTFPFSTDIYGQDYELFQAETNDFARQLHYRWPYWSELNWMDVSPGYSGSKKKYSDYSMSIFLQLNTGKSDYIKKLNEIVTAGRKKAGNDSYKLANYLCNWLYQNVDYNTSLATNSAYVAVMKKEAICGGFSNALKDLCDIAGIPCMVLTNQMEMDHAWNEIYINGKWYTADVLGTVYSKSDQNDRAKGTFLFTDPNAKCDDPAFLQKLKNEQKAPTPIITKRNSLVVSNTVNIKKYIGNRSSQAKVSFRSSKPSVLSVDAKGNVSPGIEGTADIHIKVIQNKKTYPLTLKVKNVFPKKGSKLAYKNGIYKIKKPARTKKNKIVAGTITFAGLSNKNLKSFILPDKIKIGKVPYRIVQIEKNAFSGCKNLKTLTIKPTTLTKSTVGNNALKGIHPKAVIKVPKSKRSAYRKLLKSKGAGKKVTIK